LLRSSRLDRLVALTTTDNKSSLRALEKLGMRHLGETQHERVHGTYQLFEFTRTSRRQ
jgi:RimJ/RimL family protein N-acetyltransferase